MWVFKVNDTGAWLEYSVKSCIVSLKIDENRYKQKISTDPYFGCYSYAVFTTKF